MRARRLIAGSAAAALLAGVGFVTLTWYRYGRVARGGDEDELLDRFMPDFEVRERHEVQVAAPAAVTFASARGLELHRSPLIRGIFRARELLMAATPARDRAPQRPFLDEVLSLGWRILAEEPDREIVVGAVTQPWRADVVFRGIPPEEFATFPEAGYVKIAWTLTVAPLGPRDSVFRTETRAIATDSESRARFRRYWTVVSPGIRLIRRETLRLVKREAEARAGGKG
jgi:hypothetical protein